MKIKEHTPPAENPQSIRNEIDCILQCITDNPKLEGQGMLEVYSMNDTLKGMRQAMEHVIVNHG